MTRGELVTVITRRAGITKEQAEVALDAFLQGVIRSLEGGERVSIPGFGTFSVVHRQGRDGRSPLTGRPIKIPPRKVARFSPGKALKEKLA